MGRSGTRTFLAALIAVVFVFASLAGSADAKGKKRKKAATTEQQKALASLSGVYKFGMTRKQVLGALTKQIKERYAEKIANTNDVYAQDKFRSDRKKQIKRVRKSWVEFSGKKTGWDVSIVDDQFRHKTDEAMMVHWETHEGRDQRRFFFFHNGELYKMFIALSTAAITGKKNFAFFQSLMEKRFGSGKVGFRKDKDGVEWPAFIDWNTAKYHVKALDKLQFYGAFCLSIADQAREQELASIRAERAPPAAKPNAIIEAVKSDGSDDPDISEGSGTIDSILKNQ